MSTNEAGKTVCPTCMGKKVISGICETSSEWEGIKATDQEGNDPDLNPSGQICTPDAQCPTCGGKGYL